MHPPNSGTLLEDFIAIENQLHTDNESSYETLQKRDRIIGQASHHLKKRPVSQLRYWSNSVEPSQQRSNLKHANNIISWALVIFGTVFGAGMALAVFNYNGDQPINIINLLIVAVGLQLCMLALLLVSWIPQTISKKIPGLQFIHQLIAGLSPAKWATRLAQLSPKLHHTLAPLFQNNALSNKDSIIKWQLSYWSQLFALVFNIALITVCFYLVASRDLAFGWSSTLEIQTLNIKSVTDLLSWIWKPFLPEASPSLDLIETTRFYRLGEGSFANQAGDMFNQAQTAGLWWSFILLCLFCYGLLPRLMTLLISQYRLTVHIKRSLMALPGAYLVLDRMNRPAVRTLADEPETDTTPTKSIEPASITALIQRDLFIYHWGQPAAKSEQLTQWIIQRAQCQVTQFQITAVDDDDFLPKLVDLPAINSKDQALVIIVKAWEPPTLELTDWLDDLRQHYGAARLIALVPYNINELSQLCQVDDLHYQMWQDFLMRNGSHHVELHKV